MIQRFNEAIRDTIIEEKDGVLLPMKMGIIMVTTFGKRTYAIDPVTSQKKGEVVYYRNLHSEGMGGGVYYTPKTEATAMSDKRMLFANARYWYFEAGRHTNRAITKAYRTDWKKYWKLTPSRRLVDVLDTYRSKRIRKIKENKIKKDYDEFKF